MDDGELLALREKVRELLALRALGAADPPADRLRTLAARYPGALRELDRAPIERLTAQLADLDEALTMRVLPPWAKAMSRYHGWLRIGLRLRAEADRGDAAALSWAAGYVPVFPGDPMRERLGPEVLRSLARPPDGRLVRVALRLAAEDALVAPALLEALLDHR